MRPSAADRLERSSMLVPWSGCRLWLGYQSIGGYGQLFFNGRVEAAHRVAWQQTNGPIPDGLCVLHKCDVRCCINVKHLFLGTYADNARDRDAKGRAACVVGEKNPAAKLSSEQVAAILIDRRSRVEIANDYGVTIHCIKRIRAHRTWKHLA